MCLLLAIAVRSQVVRVTVVGGGDGGDAIGTLLFSNVSVDTAK